MIRIVGKLRLKPANETGRAGLTAAPPGVV